MVSRTTPMHLPLKANVLKAPEGREGLHSLLSLSPTPSSSTHKVYFPKKAPGSSPSSWPTTRVVKFLPFLTLHLKMFMTWLSEGKPFKPPHDERPLGPLQGREDLFQK